MRCRGRLASNPSHRSQDSSALAQRALDLLPTGDHTRTANAAAPAAQQAFGGLPAVSYARATSAIALAETPRERGDLVASERAYARAREIAEECGNTPMAVSAVAYMAHQQAKQGHLHRALETNRQALQLAIDPGGQELPAAGLPYVKMGDLMREWDELETAIQYLERGVELCLQWGHADALITGHTTLARPTGSGRACPGRRYVPSCRATPLQDGHRPLGDLLDR